jgi:hypothetical protein
MLRFTASVAAATLCFGLFAATPGLAQGGTLGDTTTFLGLEGQGDRASALSDALRWDLNQRGREDGNTMSLAELKLTMGCGDNDLPCLAQGGETLGSGELVFGTLSRNGGIWTVRLQSLNVGLGELNNSVERELSDDDLNETSLGKTAASLIDALYKIEATDADIPPGKEIIGPIQADEGADAKSGRRSDSALVWGPYSPRPSWKLAGVGVSGALTLAALATAIGTTVAISPNGSIRKELLAAAEQSLTDDKPGNDISPNNSGDLCALARNPPNPNKPDEVTNKPMTEICIKADGIATVATISWAATGVFALSTAAFTTLLFVHKRDATVAKLIEHDVGFGGAPLREGGFMLGGSLRF